MKAFSLSVQKLMPRLSFFSQKLLKVEGQGHGIQNFGKDRKVLPQVICRYDMKALSLWIQKLCLRLNFFPSQGQGHEAQIFGTDGKVSSQRKHV